VWIMGTRSPKVVYQCDWWAWNHLLVLHRATISLCPCLLLTTSIPRAELQTLLIYIMLSNWMDSQSIFGRIIGDPTHRPECTGARCCNTVRQEYRVYATIDLAQLDINSAGITLQAELAKVAKNMLCDECKLKNRRAREIARNGSVRWSNTAQRYSHKTSRPAMLRLSVCEGSSPVLSIHTIGRPAFHTRSTKSVNKKTGLVVPVYPVLAI
jgi:hypothetical protein